MKPGAVVAGIGAAALVAETILTGLLLARPPQVHTIVREHTVQVRTIDRQASVSHLGLCLNQIYDPGTGDVSAVVAEQPADTDGVVSCAVGTFVSVVPGR